MNENKNENGQETALEVYIPDPGKALRPQHKQTKLTRKKKLEALKYLGEEFNISRAASKLGIYRSTLIRCMNSDEQFKDAVQEIKEGYIDTVENAGFKVALQPTRNGYNDRKLLLEAHRSEVYKRDSGTTVNVAVINNNTAVPEMRKVLDDNAVEVE